MPGQVTIHNTVAANITATLSGPNSGNTQGKCSAGGHITLDLSKMTGWKDGDTISLSVHADAGVTRHNNAGEFRHDNDYRYEVKGTLDAFSVEGPK